ncbi:tyrosine-type recombinase/integrase [Vibrio sp. PNB22_2_2]
MQNHGCSTYRLADGGSLYLRVKNSGAKTWEFKYKKLIDNKYSYMGLGRYPDISLAEARTQAEKFRQIVKEGWDPKLHRDDEIKKRIQENVPFSTVAAEYLDSIVNSASPKTYTDKESKIRRHLVPKFGKVPLKQISPRVVTNFLRKYEDIGKLALLHKLIGLVSQIFDYAVQEDYINSHSMRVIRGRFKKPEEENAPYLDNIEDLSFLMTKMSAARMEFVTRGLFLWQTYTMLRASSACETKWSDIDYKKRECIIDKGRMKKSRDHTFPLTPEMLSLLKEMEPFRDDSGYIFPSKRGSSPHVDSETVNKALVNNGFQGKVSSHGLRATAVTITSKTYKGGAYSKEVKELLKLCLSHKIHIGPIDAYLHDDYLESRRDIMEYWTKTVESLLPIKFKLENYVTKRR